MKTKVIAMYLPQYHQIPENDEFWGKGFTDWVPVKNAKPLFEGHLQPRKPLNNNYYDLSLKDNISWQAKLAKENGIYGFGIYHYWFNNEKNLLTRPAELLLKDKEIDINFFFSWDNTVWKRSWSNVKGGNSWAPAFENVGSIKKGPEILIPYILGSERDWEIHYNYLKPYFMDSRYIRKDDKPIFMILHYSPDIAKMCKYWETLALKDGFKGLCFIYRYDKKEKIPEQELVFKYEPIFSGWTPHTILDRIINKIRIKFNNSEGPRVLNYDRIWKKILKHSLRMSRPNVFHGAFVSYDDTPRRGRKGIVVDQANPAKFGNYFSELKRISNKQNKEFIFLTAWNEWGEGATLEPDELYKYDYLKAISK